MITPSDRTMPSVGDVCSHRVALLEELDREDRGQAAEDVEVVPLDDVPDGRGDDDAAELFEWNFRRRHKPPLLFYCASSSRSPSRGGSLQPRCQARDQRKPLILCPSSDRPGDGPWYWNQSGRVRRPYGDGGLATTPRPRTSP